MSAHDHDGNACDCPDYERLAREQVEIALRWDGPNHVAVKHLAAAKVYAILSLRRA